jgi:parallel beta-helix repeat protein
MTKAVRSHRFLAILALLALLAPAGCPGHDALAQNSTIYVDADAMGNNNGTSWEDAYTTLQPALEDAADGAEIWVAEGIYVPTQETSPGDPRSASFQLKNGVALYGGFHPSVGDTGWEDRDWVSNVTVLSGDIGTVEDPTDNSYHVIYNPDELALDGSAVLDGFTVTGGNADGAEWPNTHGAGLYNSFSSSPTVTNCTFSSNSARYGGGMANRGLSSPVVTNCTFSHNSASDGGGGMYNSDSSAPVVTNCTFSGNSAGKGAGMLNGYSWPVVTNCTFSENSASWYGGGMSNDAYSAPVVTNCTFSGNSAAWWGGGMVNYTGSLPAVTNSILWGDSPSEIYNDYGGGSAVSYSDIQSGYLGEGNVDADPLFVDAATRDLHLQPGSPAIDAGLDSYVVGVTTDLDGNPRIMGASVDMGAYEQAPSSQLTATTATCGQFKDGMAADLSEVLYSTKNGRITAVTPNSFTYFVSVTAPSADAFNVLIAQSVVPPFSTMTPQTGQAVLYDGNCAQLPKKAASAKLDASGSLTINFAAGESGRTSYVMAKYSTSSVVRKPVGQDATVNYTFSAAFDGLEPFTQDSLTLRPQ